MKGTGNPVFCTVLNYATLYIKDWDFKNVSNFSKKT